jgi:hypothetical protein
VEIVSSNIDDLLASLPKYTPAEKLDNLLQQIGERTQALGEDSEFDCSTDYPLLVLRDPGELDYLLQVLIDGGLVKPSPDGVQLTMQGWERVQEIARVGRSSNRVFVAMWFDPSMNDVYERAIEPAIKEAGYAPLRVDRSEHVNRIDDEIIGQVRKSRFMVADFTGQLTARVMLAKSSNSVASIQARSAALVSA